MTRTPCTTRNSAKTYRLREPTALAERAVRALEVAHLDLAQVAQLVGLLLPQAPELVLVRALEAWTRGPKREFGRIVGLKCDVESGSAAALIAWAFRRSGFWCAFYAPKEPK